MDPCKKSLNYPIWMPIETAQKDGTQLLLYRPEIVFVGYYGGANSGWRHNAPGLPAMCPEPTHWMSLPPLLCSLTTITESDVLCMWEPGADMHVTMCGPPITVFPDGDPRQNNYKFCPYCGERLTQDEKSTP